MKSVEEVLADELILAAGQWFSDSHTVKKKNEQERIAMASR